MPDSPNSTVTPQARAKWPRIGVRIPGWSGISNSLWEGLLEAATIAGGWRFATDRSKTLGELPMEPLDANWRGDGIITLRMTKAEGLAWKQAGIPVVNLSSEGPSPHAPRILPDNAAAGRLAANHLGDSGLLNLAYVGRQTSLHSDESLASGLPRAYSQERWQGFQEECQKHGIIPRFHLLSGHPLWESDSWERIRAEIVGFLRSLPKPCGIFAADDQLALVVVQAAHSIGIEIPKSIVIMGFGNDPEHCLTTLPTLTSVAYPGRMIGLRAAETLGAMMHGEKTEPIIRVPVTSIAERGSSAFLPSQDPVIEKVLLHIREHAPHRALQVSDLPPLTPWGLTTMKKKFQTILGRGPKEEIMRIRLNRLQELLATTDLPLSDISLRMGFGSPQDMSRFFVRATSETPSHYRSAARG